MKKHFFLLIMLATCSLGTMAQTTYNVGDVVHSCTATLDDWTISGNSNSESFQVDTWANVDSYLDAGVGYIEYWVYRDGNLSAATITHTQLKDLPEGTYSVSIKARVESEVGNTPTSGISFTANTESVDLVENGTDDATLTDGGKALVGTYTLEVEVTDGTLDIGFTVPSGANYNWLAFQYLTVTYEGKTGEELEYVTGTMNKDVEDAMKDAVDTYNESMTTENLSAATAAIAAANASVEYYASITAVVEALDEAGTAVWEASDAYTAYTNCTLSDEDLSETFAKAQIAQTTKGSDMTYVLTTTGEWTILQGNGYYNSNDDHQSPAGLPDAQETYSYGTEEYPIFTEGGVMYKTITGLPEGTYEVTFYAQENACNDVDTEHSGAGYCQAYANDVTADMSLGTTGTSGYSDDDLFTLSPVEVGEDGELKFGVTNLQTGGNWCYCMAVSLTYLGSQAITENMEGVYLLNVADGEFLSRGSEWGTEADLDHYGIPVNILVADDGTLTVQFMDSELYLYGPNWAWTDAAEADATSFTVAQAVDENGDKVESDYGTVYTFSCSAGLLYVNHSVDGLPLAVNGHKEVTTEDPNYDDDEQTYWVVVDKATRDQIKADWVEEQQAAIAASLGLSTDDLSTATGTDMTDKVSNASLVDESAADDEGSVLGGWTNTYSTNDTFSFYTYNNGTEIFQGAATLSQTVTGLTPGAYKVTIEGLMRQGSNARCYALMEGEYDLSIGYLKANDYEINLQPWYVGCSYDEGSQAYTPDNRSQASDACDNGDYDNTLYTVVGDDGELTITIGCPGTDTYGWLYVKNLKLYQLGEYDVIANENPEEPGVYYCTYSDAETDRSVANLEGVTAYILETSGVDPQGDEEHEWGRLTLTEVTDGGLAKQTGYVLKYETDVEGAVTMGIALPEADATVTAPEGNLLVAVSEATTADDLPDYAYVLSSVDDVMGFYKLEEGYSIAAGKAYADLSSVLEAEETDVKLFKMVTPDGTATAIETVASQPVSSEAVYDLSGRKVSKPQKGIYIQGGKKVLY